MEVKDNEYNEMSVQVDIKSFPSYIRDSKLEKTVYPKATLNRRCLKYKQYCSVHTLYNINHIDKDRDIKRSIFDKTSLGDCLESNQTSVKRSFSNEFYSTWKAKSNRRLNPCRSFKRKEGVRTATSSAHKESSKRSSYTKGNWFIDPSTELANLLFAKRSSVIQPKVQDYIKHTSKSPHKKHLHKRTSPSKAMPLDLPIQYSKIQLHTLNK